MIIQMDTREQSGKKDHILDYFAKHGIEVKRNKCFVGDWTLVADHSVCIDTKTLGLQEVYSNPLERITTDSAKSAPKPKRARSS